MNNSKKKVVNKYFLGGGLCLGIELLGQLFV